MTDKKFRTLVILGVIWVVLFAITLVTGARMARGATLFASAACVVWFAYWTISILVSTKTQVDKEECDEIVKELEQEIKSRNK